MNNRRDEQQQKDSKNYSSQETETRQAGANSDRFGSQNPSMNRNIERDVDTDEDADRDTQSRTEKTQTKDWSSKDQSKSSTQAPSKGKM